MIKNEEIAIQLNGVKKRYKLGQIGGGTLQGDLQSWWARLRGKEDPNTKIEQGQRLVGKTFMALNGVDLTIYKGEAIGIIGGNGAGKSTMLKLLSRVTAPTEGSIEIYGRIASMLEVGTGFNGEMTGRENVYMNGAILGMTKAEIDAKMDKIIEFSEVGDFIDTPVKRYSSGMYVKLAFSVAAHLDSEIMIMDEVLAVGDMAFQQKCLNKMSDAATKEGKTVLYVSHNMNTIRQLCTRCVVLEKGKVIFEGDVEEAISIYLGGCSNVKKIYNCRDIAREAICDGLIHINSIELLDVENSVIYDNQRLKINVNYDALEEFSNLAFRIIVFSSQAVPIGMAASDAVIKTYKGENQVTLSFDFSQLAAGNYNGRVVFYEVNQYGGEVIHDVVHQAFYFVKEKRDSTNDTTFVWKVRAWGNISFPDVEVLS